MTRIAVLLCALAALLVVPGTALATHGGTHAFDSFNSPQALGAPVGVAGPHDNATATVQASEPLTVPNDNSGCLNATGALGSGGSDMGNTLWYTYQHPTTGAASDNVSIATGGATFERAGGSVEPLDTVVAIYATTGTPTTANFVECNDDFNSLASRVDFVATDGVTYKVQIGVWDGFDDGAGGDPQTEIPLPGDINVSVDGDAIAPLGPFSHDMRSSASNLSLGQTLQDDNIASGLQVDNQNEPQESTLCNGAGYSSTMWYRVQTPSIGDVTFSAVNGINTVLAVYRGNDTSPLECNNDIGGGNLGSRVVRNALSAGTYFVQVGGVRGIQGGFDVSVSFVDRDVDRDGFASNVNDCNDGNASVNPGASEVPGNGVDDDCANGDAAVPPTNDGGGGGGGTPPPPDGDGDGVPDASDACPTQNARGGDRNGNGCLDGSVIPRGTPVLRALPTGGGIRIVSLRVDATTRGSRVSAQCSRRRACPRQTVNSRGGRVTLRRFRGIRLPAGVTLEIRITRPDAHGRLIRYRITRGNFRRSEMCIPLGSTRPVRRCGS